MLTTLRALSLRFTSVRERIWLAFATVAAITVLAALIALWSFSNARHTVSAVATQSMPQLRQIDLVALHLTNLVSVAPAMSATTEVAQIDALAAEESASLQELGTALKQLQKQASIDPKLLAELSAHSNRLVVNLDTLVSTQRHLITLRLERQEKLVASERWVDALRIALQPLVAALSQSTDRRTQFFAVQELKSEIHLVYGLLTRAASAVDEQELQRLAVQLHDAMTRLDMRLQEIPSGAARDVLIRGRDGLQQLANGETSLEALQFRYLSSQRTLANLQRNHQIFAEAINRSRQKMNLAATEEVNVTTENIDSAFNYLRLNLGILVLVALATAIVLGWLFAGPLIGNRLAALSRVVESFAKGNFDCDVPPQTPDEIGRLAGALENLKVLSKERQRIEERLAQLANFDALTGLPNRSALQNYGEEWLARCQRLNARFAVLFIDLDRFKVVNDSQGHEVGDNLLRVTSARLSQLLRRNDVVGRLGGDEFVVLADISDSLQDAEIVASKIIQELSESIHVGNMNFFVGASIGISIYPEQGDNFLELLRKADTAMYSAKQRGGNSHCFYQDDMNVRAARRIELESDLRYAIEQQTLEVWYQPKADSRTGRLTGAEALVRWRHPEQGLISPIEFIPLAEETGLIVDIGRFVLDRACLDCQQWRSVLGDTFSIAVNLSPRQLVHPQQLIDHVATSLQSSQLPANALELEVTESLLMQNMHDAVAMLRKLQANGHRIAVDDFGTGYSSLSYIKNLPIDVIKIDKAFVRGLPADKGDAAVAGAIVGIAEALKLTVVAEGVETAEQLQFLIEHRCTMVQGYLLSKPLPKPQFDRFVETYRYGGLLESDVNTHSLV